MNTIDSATRLFCILGNPTKHSLSPLIHNTAFEELGINAVYLAFEPNDLKKAVAGLREIGCAGFNVTMPFKEKIIPLLDRVDENARKIGAVNTVLNKNGVLVGYNTDSTGFISALEKKTSVREKKVLLVGAGGAGKAIAFGLSQKNCEVTIASKIFSDAEQLARKTGAKAVGLDSIKSLEKFEVLVNATPVGMKPLERQTPIDTRLLHKKLIVFDIVYNPLETLLLREAKKKGCTTINGLEMLLEQGFAAFELFTGKKAPCEKMRKAVLEALE